MTRTWNPDWGRNADPIVSVRMPKARTALLGTLAREHGLSRSELVRRALLVVTDDQLRQVAARTA